VPRTRYKAQINWDPLHKRNFENSAFSRDHWLRTARSLVASAKELEPQISDFWKNLCVHAKDQSIPLKADRYQGPYYMLLAFAVENLFKAAIIGCSSLLLKERFQLDGKFPKELQTHDLVELANKANFDFSVEEEDLLRRLTRHAIWAGRYPVPLNYKKSAGSEKFSDGHEYSVSWFGGKDVEKLNVLLARIEDELGLSRKARSR
jgi:hypothetical protein